MIYFDNAATTGIKPASVIRATEHALREYSANPGRGGHSPSVRAASAVYRAREEIASFFGASGAETVVFTMNCTHSLNCVIKGVLQRGDHAVVSSLEHNAVMRPLVKCGVEFDIARVSLSNDRLTLQEFERKIKHNTRLILCTGASNVLGKMLPIAEIGQLCRSRGILFAVDAAQIAGVVPINMKKMNIDYLCVAPHKGLYGPMGTGILICEKGIENTLIEGGTGTNSAELVQPDFLPERHESGTINVPGILGTQAGLQYVKRLGPARIYKHEMALCGTLYRALREMSHIELYTPFPEAGSYAPVLSFNVTNMTSGEAAGILNGKGIAVRGGLQCAPAAHRQIGTLNRGTVRVSFGTFNSMRELNVLIGILEKMKKV